MRSGPTRLMTPVAAAAVLALAAAGCGGGDDHKSSSKSTSSPEKAPASGGGAAAGGGATVAETGTDFKFSQPKATAKSGTVTIKLANKGQTPHAIELEGNGLKEKKTSTIGPGESTSLKVALKAGKYEFYCPVDGHKGLGMKGDLTVR